MFQYPNREPSNPTRTPTNSRPIQIPSSHPDQNNPEKKYPYIIHTSYLIPHYPHYPNPPQRQNQLLTLLPKLLMPSLHFSPIPPAQAGIFMRIRTLPSTTASIQLIMPNALLPNALKSANAA